MPRLDPLSLSTMAGLMALILGVLLLGLRHAYPERIRGLVPWGLALLLFTAGTVLHLIGHALTLTVATLFGNALLQAGFVLLMVGTQRFLGRPVRWLGALVLCLCSLALLAWFLMVTPDYRMRITVFNWAMACVGLAHMRLVLRHGSGWTSYFMVGVLLCLSGVMITRGLATWWADAPDMHIYMPSSVQGAYLAAFSFAVLLLGVSVLLMATDRVRAEFEFIASHDGLTHTLTRRSWMAAAQAALARPARKPLAVLMLDVDDFKKINDMQGHLAGDRVLASLAGVVAQAMPTDGVLGRYGGEEFIILLEGPAAQAARRVAEELREAVAAQPGLGCTVSIGLATASRNETSLDALIQRADEALYQAKHQGRNQVVEAPGEGAAANVIVLAEKAAA